MKKEGIEVPRVNRMQPLEGPNSEKILEHNKDLTEVLKIQEEISKYMPRWIDLGNSLRILSHEECSMYEVLTGQAINEPRGRYSFNLNTDVHNALRVSAEPPDSVWERYFIRLAKRNHLWSDGGENTIIYALTAHWGIDHLPQRSLSRWERRCSVPLHLTLTHRGLSLEVVRSMGDSQ